MQTPKGHLCWGEERTAIARRKASRSVKRPSARMSTSWWRAWFGPARRAALWRASSSMFVNAYSISTSGCPSIVLSCPRDAAAASLRHRPALYSASHASYCLPAYLSARVPKPGTATGKHISYQKHAGGNKNEKVCLHCWPVLIIPEYNGMQDSLVFYDLASKIGIFCIPKS